MAVACIRSVGSQLGINMDKIVNPEIQRKLSKIVGEYLKDFRNTKNIFQEQFRKDRHQSLPRRICNSIHAFATTKKMTTRKKTEIAGLAALSLFIASKSLPSLPIMALLGYLGYKYYTA